MIVILRRSASLAETLLLDLPEKPFFSFPANP
jgi:hypothetical protein